MTQLEEPVISEKVAAEVTPVAPGSAQSLYLVVSDIVEGARFQPDGSSARLDGPAPDHFGGRPRRAPKPHQAARRELALLVRRVHAL